MSRPNVLWITLDSVRSDHTAMDGYRRDTTPELADLASTGIGFSNCIAQGKDTLSSSGAILTGLAPTRSTVGITGEVLPAEVRTVAERFADAGYLTAALSGNSYVSEETELARGFERFQWLSSSTLHQVSPRVLLGYLSHIRSHSAGFTLDAAKHSTPYLMNGVAKRWLRDFESDDRPFFYYLHYNQPHRPYYPPGAFRDRFTGEIEMSADEAAETSLRIHRNLEEIIATGTDLTDQEWDALLAMYDAEIAYTDHMIGRLLEWLRRRELGDTVVVVTADHGELFGEYGLLSHKYVLDDAVTRVPLVLATLDGTEPTGEGADRAGVDPTELAVGPDAIVQHCDVMRTLLETGGADTDGMLGEDLYSSGRDFAVSQRAARDFELIRQHNPDWDASRFHDDVVSALRTAEWRYYRSEGRRELFAIADETDEVAAEHPEVAQRLDDQLTAWLEANGTPISEGRAGEFSDATRQQLRELGYID